MNRRISVGDYVIVRRQGYTKLHKIRENGTFQLGNFVIEVNNAISEKYSTTFQMKQKKGHRKLYVLEKVTQLTSVSQIGIETSGKDNRDITDDDSSQALTIKDIEQLKDDAVDSNDIVEKLISNSKTFNSKTEFSQEKYMIKKEKKYFKYVQFERPTLRLLAEMFYRQDPAKVLGIRIDDLSQILSYANVQSDGKFLLYDSGTSGLIPAAILTSIGANNDGVLVHMHPGNECQRNASLALKFPEEQLRRCINVNLYSVLRCFYQETLAEDVKLNKTITERGGKSECLEKTVNHSTESGANVMEADDIHNESNIREEDVEIPAKKRKLNDYSDDERTVKKSWQEDNKRACVVLLDKVDGLIVTAKEHPVNIVKELIPFLKPSRSLVVYSALKEPLQELYVYLKNNADFIGIKLFSSFMRNYQVLPERTHPFVNMTSGGFILTCFKLNQ